MKIKIILTSMLALLTIANLAAQKPIDGIVTDELGAPLVGVTILIKGTTKGTTTNSLGTFHLDKVNPADVITVSFIGYDSHEFTVGTQARHKISLKPSATSLEEVVVIGYGTSRRKDLTGAISSMAGSVVANTATANYDQALAGRIAGVAVSAVDGAPGEGLNIVIRGGNSITGDNSPLYVVDGIPIERFDPGSISSNDILSFDVMKDASATAIYGSRGANGVIAITTKSGRSDGKTDIYAKFTNGVSWIPSRLEVMGPYDYVKYMREIAYASDNYSPGGGDKVKFFEKTWGDDLDYYRNTKGTSWQDEIFRIAPFSQGNFSVSGGNATTTIYYSGEILDQRGTIINSGFNKAINNFRFTHKINPNTKLGGQIIYSYSKISGMNIKGNSYSSVIKDAVQFRPVEPRNGDGLGEGGFDPDDQSYNFMFNPVENLSNTDRRDRSEFLRSNATMTHNFNKKLVLNLAANFQTTLRKNSVFYGLETQQGRKGANGINGTITNYRTLLMGTSNTLTYKDTKGNSSFGGMFGVEAQSVENENSSLGNNLLPTDIFGIDKLGGLAANPSNPTSYRGLNALSSFFGRVDYNYAGKYLATVNFRADGSSKFKKENRWGYFPSFSGAWRLSEESFLKKSTVVSNLKLRGGWGRTGNNRIGDYDALTLLDVSSSSGYVIGNNKDYIPGTFVRSLGMSDLRWETTEQTNIGVDLGLFKQRVEVIIDAYYKKTFDLLLDAQMSPSTGFSTAQQNIGQISNKGVEFTLNTVNINTPNFKWSTSFNISLNRNKVLKLVDGQQAIYTNPNYYNSYSEYMYITEVGRPVGLIYGLQFDRLYQWSDFDIDPVTMGAKLKPGIPDNGAASVAPGSVKYKDQNGDGTINNDDRVVIGNPQPIHFGGITNDFIFAKNFDASIFFQWSYGGQILNGGRTVFEVAQVNKFNGFRALSDTWTPTNTNTTTNAIRYNNVYGAPPKGNNLDDRYIEDGSYLKLKTITIGYSLPKKIINKIGVKRFRVFASGQNLITWTKYSGYDPDVSVGKYGALTPRLDYSAYPQSSTAVGGVEITF